MNRFKVPLVLGVATVAIAWIVFTGVSDNDLYMSPLDEWDADRARVERVRVVGWVQEGSVQEADDALLTDFVMRNEGGDLAQPMRFRGVLPDLFREGQNVTAAGRLGEDGVFHADELMTKCPSKYEGQGEHPEGIPLPGAAGDTAARDALGPATAAAGL